VIAFSLVVLNLLAASFLFFRLRKDTKVLFSMLLHLGHHIGLYLLRKILQVLKLLIVVVELGCSLLPFKVEHVFKAIQMLFNLAHLRLLFVV
jgi:hypothetical protein